MRGNNMETMGLIMVDLLENFCAYIIPSLIFAMLMGCLFWNIQKNGIRNVIISYLTEMRYNGRLIYQFLFFLYVYFIFDRTLLSRHFGWSSGLGNIMGGWTLLDPETGKITFEAVENFAFFVPYIILFFLSFNTGKRGMEILKKSFFVGALTSIFIEMGQMIFKVGEFQISDLTYNTLGAVIGGVIFLVGGSLKNKCTKKKIKGKQL